MQRVRRKLLLCALSAFMCGTSCAAFAQEDRWPAKPVRLIVTFPPGGSSDLIARLIAPKLAAALGQQFIVDNRAGADGMIGSEFVAKAAPDGYTFLISNVGPQGIAQSLYRKIRYDALRDFTHIAHLGAIAHVLVVTTSFPVQNLPAFVKLARAKPGEINFGSGGPINHLTGELLNAKAGIKLTHVPYKGTAASIIEVRGGMVPAAIAPLPATIEMMRAKQLRALAVTSAQRSPLAPEVPTFVELGYPDLVVENWVGISGPAKLRDDLVNRMAAESRNLMNAPELRSRFNELGVGLQFKGPEEYTAYVRAEIEKWRAIVVSSGAQVE